MADILLMDDECALREVIAEVLEEEGHTVIQSDTGRIAYDEGVIGRVDLVITDIIMPDVEGMEAIRAIRKARPDLPILAISGGGRTVTADFLPVAREFGAADTLKKPFAPEELVERVAGLLAGRAAA